MCIRDSPRKAPAVWTHGVGGGAGPEGAGMTLLQPRVTPTGRAGNGRGRAEPADPGVPLAPSPVRAPAAGQGARGRREPRRGGLLRDGAETVRRVPARP